MTHNLLIIGLDDRVFNFPIEEDVQTTILKQWFVQKQDVAVNFHLTLGGVPLEETDVISCGPEWHTTLIRAHPIISGGKGGFGALIRAVGSRANRSNNKEACRDLSGRRLRDVNAQKNVTKWLENEPERKKKRREEKRKRLLQKKVPPKHFFDDQAYMQQMRANEEDMDSALKQGLVASSSKGLKRKQPVPDGATASSGSKKAKLWMEGVEEDDSMSSEELEDSEDEYDPEHTGQCASEESQGSSSSSNADQGPMLNSAGSSDEAVGSKPSDKEANDDVCTEQCTRNDAVATDEIYIPPLKKTEQNLEQNGSVCDGSMTSGVTAKESPAENGQQSGEQNNTASHDASNVEDQSSHEQPVTEGQHKEEVTVAQTESISDEQAQPSPHGPLNLDEYSSAAELESVGAERLKSVLQSLGLKCGGTVQERAQRLFSTKGKSLEELDPHLFAKAGKSRKRKNK